jgi:hypothetical protein
MVEWVPYLLSELCCWSTASAAGLDGGCGVLILSEDCRPLR